MKIFAVLIDWTKANEQLIRNYQGRLENTRRQRMKRLMRFEDRFRHLIASCIIDDFWSRMSPSEDLVTLGYTKFGRPYFMSTEAVDFNISHSGNWVVGIFDEAAVGIDVERKDSLLQIPSLYFSDDEITLLKDLTKDEAKEIMLKWWTLKEASVKCIGTGLSTPLKNLSFDLDGQPLNQNKKKTCKVAFQLKSYHYTNFNLDEQHIISTCSKNRIFTEQVEKFSASELLGNVWKN